MTIVYVPHRIYLNSNLFLLIFSDIWQSLSKARRQHFVPRFYLKNFGDPKIFCYDKSNDKVVKTNVNDIALVRNFYELENLTSGEIEKFLSKKESKFSKAYYEVIDRKDISKLTKESSYHFFMFIATQLVRTSGFRLEIENMLSKAFDKMYSKLANKHLKKKGNKLAGRVRVSPDPEVAKLMHTQMILEQVPEFAHILSKRYWMIDENLNDIPLWTSDNPFVLRNELNYSGNLGLMSLGIEIHFPLTSNLLLTSFDLRTHQLRRGYVGTLERIHLIHENMLQVQASTRYIYASSDNDFDRARKIISDYPQFKSRIQRLQVY
jgi:hypothetical protein